MTPEERKKLEEELRQIELDNAADMKLLNDAPISSTSTALTSSMPPPSALSGWNSDHSINARQSPEYQRKKSADEAVDEAKETANQDASLLTSVGDAYEGVGNALVGGAESIVGRADGGDVATFFGTGYAAVEGANQIRNKYKDGRAKGTQDALAQMDKKMGEGKSNSISAMKDFKDKLAKEGIDYDDLKQRPGTMREKLTAVYNEQLAKKYPTWGSRTFPGKVGRVLSGTDVVRPKISGIARALPTTVGVLGVLPGVKGAFDSFSRGSDADDALKELPALEEKAKQFDLEYKSIQLDFADDWFSRNNPDMHPPGVYEKRLATRAILQAQIDQMK